ncbi:hypothetical protein Tco_1551477 [Tanacetum coccineum]
MIQELSGDPREGSATRNETQDDRDSLDSDKTLRAPKLEYVDEGEEDDASNFMVIMFTYLNETLEPSLEDVGLPRIVGTSGLNSHDESSRKEEPSGDSVNLDRLTKSQTVVVSKVTTNVVPP